MSSEVIYDNGELELKVSVNDETIWLNQSQMSELFDTSRDNIGLHLKNIYKEKELDENSTTEDFLVVRLKDLGEKWFALNKMDEKSISLMEKLK